jgi:crotonobetainyl-CoA:carnitine CoA-transferase CaiB-like acyl-CoA transferase
VPVSGPLAGVRILDLTTVVMGPYATQILADFGADVVKVEPVEGDIMRFAGPMRNPGMGHVFLNTNRNKRSIVLDLKHPAGLEAALKLAKTADVLVYNIRPAAMARLGLSYEAVRKANPKILYVGAFGYSQEGPYAARPAYDDLIQAAAGVPWLMQVSGADQPRYVPSTYADRTVGLHVVNAVTAALFNRERTGKGQRIDVPMFESLLQTLLGEHLSGRTFVPPMPGEGYARVISKERRPYRTSDGWVCVLVYNDKQWRNFFELIGQPETYDGDPRFCSQTARIANIDAVYAYLGERMLERTTAAWLEGFEKFDIPAARMNSLADVFADPHLRATGYFGEIDHPSEGRLTSLKTPSEWSESTPEYRLHAPRLGEHTREILREAGYDEAALERMIASGAAKQSGK